MFIGWLIMILPVVSAGEGRCIEKERQALLRFKAGVVDENGMLSSWREDNRDCCQWKGVTCSNLITDPDAASSHIQRLELAADFNEQLFLRGNISTSLVELQHLRYLDLSSNYFNENNMPEFFVSLINLRYIDLSSCYLGGKIPSHQFGFLFNLKHLNLAGNGLEGSIPHELGNLSKLQYLDLGGNALEGTIPFQLGNLSSLQEISLRDNGALKIDDGTGSQQWLSALTSLTHLDLSGIYNLGHSHNWIQTIANMSKLRELRLSGCDFSDQFVLSSIITITKFNFSNSIAVLDLSWNTFTSHKILSWVSSFTPKLVDLDLSVNNLKGSSNIYSLQELDFSSNSITGTLSGLSKFRLLKRLDLSFNQLSGKIPEDAKLPPHLEYVSMESNSLEGSIPTSVFENTCNLSSLKLDYNKLSGDLSVVIHQLSGCARFSLQELNLANNNIKGMLPDLSMFSALKTLDLSGNKLNGTIPEESRLPSELEVLSIKSNFLEGGIPKLFGNTCKLGSFDMSSNNLNEELPVIIQHLSGCTRYSLQELMLENNQIHGSLPDFSIFPSLQQLSLGKNKLNGTIPGYVQFPSQLDTLDLSSNHLKGVITDSHLANMSNLKTLDLSGNSATLAFSQHWIPSFQLEDIALSSCQLGPAFPEWLQTQNRFNSLDISSAGISDIVPNWFWAKLELEKLTSINISSNSLKGTIPNLPIKACSFFLYLSWNHFEGPIPPFLRGVASLDLSRNRFSDSQSFVCTNGTVESLTELDLSHNQLSGLIPDCWSQF
ncbi:hypothetical protein PIB30_095312, partial [Stylosanthes scabra]|nr:hypothetical protein [Stylosanthes scabra]